MKVKGTDGMGESIRNSGNTSTKKGGGGKKGGGRKGGSGSCGTYTLPDSLGRRIHTNSVLHLCCIAK